MVVSVPPTIRLIDTWTTRTRPRYSLPAPMRTDWPRYRPPPVGIVSDQSVLVMSVSWVATEFSRMVAVRPTGSPRRPAPPVTEVVVPAPATVHAPPVSAVPSPAATVRSNASAATVTAPAGGAVTVTGRVVVPVALSSSVTVSVTV